VLQEDLVRRKTELIADHCVHRGASMLYGRVEERGIACAYHGWLYDTNGNCLETPAEPADSKFYLTVRIKAYPVQKFVGLYWAYLGPDPAPVIPKFDVWVSPEGVRKIDVYPRLDCNWFQAMENSVDPAHLQILHQGSGGRSNATNTTRGLTDEVDRFDFYEVPYGIIKKRIYKNGIVDEHPLIFPNILRVSNSTQIRVPIDDTHTNIYFVRFVPNEYANGSAGMSVEDAAEVNYLEPFKTPGRRPASEHAHADGPRAGAGPHGVGDAGPNRGPDDRATGDDRPWRRDAAPGHEAGDRKVQRGEDPLGVLRDPDHPMIDTHLEQSIKEMIETRGAGFLELMPGDCG
jgi:nitrite reductase/ring-hydroxylating ferredoxin subunit